MAQRSLFWDGTVLGDCGPYNQTHVNDQFFRAILNGTGDRGVLFGWSDQLEVSGTSSPLSVAAGAGIVYGMFYENDEPVSVSVSTPSAGFSRYDLIVVRRDWGTQTARVGRVAGVAAATPAIPALTQTAGTVYEIPLATVLISDAGAITLTDTRNWCTFSSEWTGGVVTATHFYPGAVTAAKIPNRSRYFLKEAGQLAPDSANPPTWTVGGSYDYWSFVNAATNTVWLYHTVPYSQAGATLSIYLWTVPNAAAAGNVRWDYNYAVNAANTLAAFTTGNVLVAQGGRAVTNVYRDLLIAIPAAAASQFVTLGISRVGGADTYGDTQHLLGVEFAWTADA